MVGTNPEQERKLREEEAKLTGAWMNGVSVALFAVGALQPLMAQTFSRWSLLLLLASFVVHLGARAMLASMFPKE